MSSHMNSEASISDSIATHMLVFMVQGYFRHLNSHMHSFQQLHFPGGILYPLVWECIAHLDMLGFKVLTLTADGASSNRKNFKLNSADSKASFTYKTTNVYSQNSSQPLFFSVMFLT